MNSPRVPLRATGRRVLEALRDHGPLTRSQIADRAGLPRPTVVTAVTALLDADAVTVDQAGQETRRGRPSSTVDLAWSPLTTLLVDWQRSGIRARRLARPDGSEPDGGVAVPHDAVDTVEALAAAVDDAWSQLAPDAPRPTRVVLSVPAPVHSGVHSLATAGPLLASRRHGVPRQLVPEWLTERDPAGVLAGLVGCPVVIENDANTAALGEVHGHEGGSGRNALVVSIEDGIGAGLVLDGRLHRGSDGIAGELAHLQVAPNGRLCACGSRGCLVTELSDGPLFATEISAAYGHEVTLPDVMRLVAAGDPGVLRVVSDVGSLIGGQIATAVAWLNLDTVVVDGGLGPAADVVAEAVRSEIQARVTPRAAQAVTVRTGLPDGSARVVGAAVLARQAYANEVLAADF